MTYSSALFDNKNTNLSDAQFNKYRKIAETLSLDSNSKTLEIGCGWGGFSSFVAKNYNCSVDAITISKEQYEYASKKIHLKITFKTHCIIWLLFSCIIFTTFVNYF